jgi:hypothetical protein
LSFGKAINTKRRIIVDMGGTDYCKIRIEIFAGKGINMEIV